MALFKLKSDRVEVTKNLSLLKPFRDISTRDDSDMLFTYIYHMYDWSSPYSVYTIEDRQVKLIKELFDGEQPPEDILQPAIDLYIELNTSSTLRLLESAKKAVNKLQTYFEQVTLLGEQNEGRAAKDLMSNLKDVGNIINSIKQWEEMVKKEKDSTTIRKGVEIDEFNE